VPVLEWLAGLPHAVALRESGTAYLLVNAAHILSVGLIVGAILPLDIRLLSGLRNVPLAAAGPLLSRTAAIGVVLAVGTGFFLFSVKPVEYAHNPAFLAKLCLLAVGILNAAWLHAGSGWSRALAGEPGPAVRLHALVSACAWPAALVAGRWIGFI